MMRHEDYMCPECHKPFKGNWINRHLVKEHGYQYFDNNQVYPPVRGGEDK